MTTVHRLAETSGKDECIMVSGTPRGQPGLYVASVLYMKRSSHVSVLSLARKQAEGWIKSNLFPGYTVRRMWET